MTSRAPPSEAGEAGARGRGRGAGPPWAGGAEQLRGEVWVGTAGPEQARVTAGTEQVEVRARQAPRVFIGPGWAGPCRGGGGGVPRGGQWRGPDSSTCAGHSRSSKRP